MQIRQETVERIIDVLLDQIDEKKKTICDLNYVVAEQAEENVEKSEIISESLMKLKDGELRREQIADTLMRVPKIKTTI